MRLLSCLVLMLFLCSCEIIVGDFPEKREKLHNMGDRAENYCEIHPDRCIDGVPW